jgi:hypothetical protein
MAYNQEEKESIFKSIISDIENGASLRCCLRKDKMPSSSTFFIWLEEDENKSKQYARATELRAENMFEDILSIVDENTNDTITLEDGKEIVNNDVIQRARLRMDARKWMLAKMNPKKYGDKVQQEHSGEVTQNIISLGNGINPDEAT